MSAQQRHATWDAAVDATVLQWQAKKLLRVQRPTIAALSSTEALISEQDLHAWVQGTYCEPVQQAPLTQQPACGLSPSPTSHQWQTIISTSTIPTERTLTPIPNTNLRRLKLFSLNDYLGLASHPDVCEAAASAAKTYGMGYRSSAIVGGTTSLHRELEESLACLKGTEDCLLFPTGFAANVAVVSTLAGLGGKTAILSDELNHASIIDGARLALRSGSDVTLYVYRHNDMSHLEELLSQLPSGTRAMVVTDTLFSMDGDFADLKALARLRAKYGFLLCIDEAHATLVAGERGAGTAEAMGVAEQVDVHVGTLSKAFGALGGFVACNRNIKSLLINKGRPYMYSTALPIPVVAAAQAALAVSYRESWRRQHLWSLVEWLGQGLGVTALSPVIPLVVGSETEALRLGADMLRRGLHVPSIRPPTVPTGTCRLRVSLSAAHTVQDIGELIHAVRDSGAVLQDLPFLTAQARQWRSEGWCMPFGWPICKDGPSYTVNADLDNHSVKPFRQNNLFQRTSKL